MKQIGQHTFVELKEMQEILIEDNLIQYIQRRAFASLDNLKIIKLKGNRINEISEEAFQNIPALKEYVQFVYIPSSLTKALICQSVTVLRISTVKQWRLGSNYIVATLQYD